jgi:hypothetical protein
MLLAPRNRQFDTEKMHDESIAEQTSDAATAALSERERAAIEAVIEFVRRIKRKPVADPSRDDADQQA